MARGSALCIGRIRSLHLRDLHAVQVLKHAVQGNMGDLCLIIVIAQLDLYSMHLCRAARSSTIPQNNAARQC